MNSMTRKCIPPASSASMARTRFGWSSLAAASASRWNRATESGSLVTDGGRIFSATTRLSRCCSALNTTPIPPAPSLSSTKNRPMTSPFALPWQTAPA